MSGRGRTGSGRTKNCYEDVSKRTDGMTGEGVAARLAGLRRHAPAAGWPTSSTEGIRGCLGMETSRFLFDDGRTLPRRLTSGKTQRDRWVEGWAASGQDAGSYMRQRYRESDGLPALRKARDAATSHHGDRI